MAAFGQNTRNRGQTVYIHEGVAGCHFPRVLPIQAGGFDEVGCHRFECPCPVAGESAQKHRSEPSERTCIAFSFELVENRAGFLQHSIARKNAPVHPVGDRILGITLVPQTTRFDCLAEVPL